MTHDLRRYTAPEAAKRLNIPSARIAEWKARGKVNPVGYVPGVGVTRRQPLYRLEDLQPLADAYHARQATRRAKR